MWKKLAIGAFSLWVITLGVAGYFFEKRQLRQVMMGALLLNLNGMNEILFLPR